MIQKKKIAIGLIYFVLFVGIFSVILKDKSIEIASTDAPSKQDDQQVVGGIYNDMVCEQYFVIQPTQMLRSVEIQFVTYCDTLNTDGVIFDLYTDKDQQLYSTIISGDDLCDGGYYKVEFPEDYRSKTGRFYFTVTGTDSRTDKIPPAILGTEYDGASKELYINDELQTYQLNVIYTCTEENYSRLVTWGMQLLLCLLLTVVNFPKIKNKKHLRMIQVGVFIGNVLVIEEITGELGMPGIAMNPAITGITYVLIASIQLVLLGVLGSVTMSVNVTDTFLATFALANYFVMLFRGTTIIPLDIFSVKTLSSVIDTYTIALTTNQMLAIMWLLIWIRLVLGLSHSTNSIVPTDEKERGVARRVGLCILSVLIGIVGVIECGSPKVLAKANVQANIWAGAEGYYSNGVLMNFMMNAQYTKIKKPKGYTREKAEEILARYEEYEEETGAAPNIIIVMNESLTNYDDYESNALSLNRDPLPFLHSMTENTVKGRCYVSIFGGGTANSEFEALTGHSMAFFPSGSVVYQQFPIDETEGMVSSLNQLGYKCVAIHPMSGNNWNRNKVYASMGFQSFLTDEYFEDPEVIRWTSDRATYSKVIEAYEEKEPGEPLFVMDITMQGHGGYEGNTEWDEPVIVEGQEFPKTNEYLSSTHVSDEAFEYLVDYFREQEEPTIIFMFGDHQPSVEPEFYDMLLGVGEDEMTLADLQKKYMTPYVLWANFDLGDISDQDISANRIASFVKHAGGVPLNAYDQFIMEFSESIPVINANGYMDKDGNWYTFEEESPYSDLIEEYHILQYGIYCDGILY